eukprot:UN02709
MLLYQKQTWGPTRRRNDMYHAIPLGQINSNARAEQEESPKAATLPEVSSTPNDLSSTPNRAIDSNSTSKSRTTDNSSTPTKL